TPITTLPDNPAHERSLRMRKYSIMMTVRLICVLLMPFVHGWWMLLPALGAIFLPYLAVVVANSVNYRRTTMQTVPQRELTTGNMNQEHSEPHLSSSESQGQRYYYDYRED